MLFRVSRSVRFTYCVWVCTVVVRCVCAFSNNISRYSLAIKSLTLPPQNHHIFVLYYGPTCPFDATVRMVLLNRPVMFQCLLAIKCTTCTCIVALSATPKGSPRIQNIGSISRKIDARRYNDWNSYHRSHLLGCSLAEKKHRRPSQTFILLRVRMCGCRTEKKCNYFSCRNCSIRRINGSLENINLRISHFRAESRKM